MSRGSILSDFFSYEVISARGNTLYGKALSLNSHCWENERIVFGGIGYRNDESAGADRAYLPLTLP